MEKPEFVEKPAIFAKGHSPFNKYPNRYRIETPFVGSSPIYHIAELL
jgi:hypothetical protein